MLPELRRLAVRAYLQRLALDDKPILVGPWRSEVGFEALYQIPFLRWCAARIPNFGSRAVYVTRGGAACLFAWPEKSVDLYALRSVTDVRRENLYDYTRTKVQKQLAVTAWDRTVLDEAADRAGIRGAYHVLHPSWMYWALDPFWTEARGLQYLLSMTDYTPLPKPELTSVSADCGGIPLPKRFVAMKFYGRATFPYPTPETHKFVSEIAGIVAAQTPVVLLNSGHRGDDHNDIPITGPNIHHLPAVPPEQNLALQAAVLGKATAFVGTYGGVAQLALRMGIPSISFWSGDFAGTAHAHLSLSQFLSHQTKVPFLTGSIGDANTWRQVLAMPLKQVAA